MASEVWTVALCRMTQAGNSDGFPGGGTFIETYPKPRLPSEEEGCLVLRPFHGFQSQPHHGVRENDRRWMDHLLHGGGLLLWGSGSALS